MKYRVWHRTTYTYDEPVTDSLGVGHLTPRALPWQYVSTPEVTIEPMPADLTHELDFYGNLATYFQVTTAAHRAAGDRDLRRRGRWSRTTTPDALAQPWEDADPDPAPRRPRAPGRPSTSRSSRARSRTPSRPASTPRPRLLPGRPVGEAVTDLMHRIHTDFTYEVGATTVTSTVDEVFAKRAGVCQDFAHLTLACLRTHGLAARYVSGYLATDPPPGRERIVGADASHAWVAVWVPGTENWLAVDPTNDQWVNDRYITAAWGRDYGDVPPLKGVIFSDATTSTLTVEVDVAPLS